jgi:hypothetical protein
LAVTVWATESLLVTVTFSPGVTVTLAGEKLKFWIVMVADPPVDGELPSELEPPDPVVVLELELEAPELQAPARTATPTSATAIMPAFRWTRALGRADRGDR